MAKQWVRVTTFIFNSVFERIHLISTALLFPALTNALLNSELVPATLTLASSLGQFEDLCWSIIPTKHP